MKKYSSKGYLIGAIFALFLSYLYSPPTWPFFITRLIPFPTLEQARVYEGTLHVKGKAHRTLKHGWSAPTYYVVDTQGQKHKIFWGYPANEHEAYESTAEGMKIKVWFDDYYGVIQEYATATQPMKDDIKGYQKNPNIVADYSFFEKEYEYVRFKKNYSGALGTPVLGLFFAFYCFIQFIRNKKLEKQGRADKFTQSAE